MKSVAQKANLVPEAFEESQVNRFNHKDINVKSETDPLVTTETLR